MALLIALLAIALLPTIYYFSRIYRNYVKARQLGIPIVVLPFDNVNPFWFLTARYFHKFFTALGFPNLLRVGHVGWEHGEKAAPFLDWGCRSFVQVTPGSNWMSIADPDVVQKLFAGERKGEFARPGETSKMLDVFGPNISTVGYSRIPDMVGL
jgi:hypothetical protein